MWERSGSTDLPSLCFPFPPPVIFKEEPLPDSPLRNFPLASPSAPFPSQSAPGSMDFSPSRPPFPYGPEVSPPCSPYSADWSPCSFPTPPRYAPTFRFPPNEAYRGANLSVPLLSPGPLPHFHTLDCRPPHFQPPSPQVGPQPPGPEGETRGGDRPPEWAGPELGAEERNTKELEKSGFGGGFRDNLPIHGITLEEGKTKDVVKSDWL